MSVLSSVYKIYIPNYLGVLATPTNIVFAFGTFVFHEAVGWIVYYIQFNRAPRGGQMCRKQGTFVLLFTGRTQGTSLASFHRGLCLVRSVCSGCTVFPPHDSIFCLEMVEVHCELCVWSTWDSLGFFNEFDRALFFIELPRVSITGNPKGAAIRGNV